MAAELANDWLDATQDLNAMVQTPAITTSNCLPTTGNTWTYPIIYYAPNPPRPIQLTLSEIEKLRKAAKADAALKDILKKFTGQIEVIVSLE